MKPALTEPTTDVGIIVGRFQINELHTAHTHLIQTVLDKHDRVLIFLGLSPLRNTIKNPLDFNARKRMINEVFPQVEVYYIEDQPSDLVWSKKLDNSIGKILTPHQSVTLYGSRDSFIKRYFGKLPVKELESNIFVSATEIRKKIANSSIATSDFRAGMIAATQSRFPTTFTCVDIAIIDKDKQRLLLGKKDGEESYRFIGGFSSPDSASFEQDARREVLEETGLEVDNFQYIGSCKIEDWRYSGEVDQVKTLFFIGQYIFGKPEAADDIALVEWLPLHDVLDGKVPIMPVHAPLLKLLQTKLDTKGQS